MNEKLILEVRQKFGLFFKELRKKKGFSQYQVAEYCNVTFQTINKVEKGKFPYSIDLLLKLSNVLDFTINFEIKETDNDDRFILQKGKEENFFICTDKKNEIVCRFEKGKFNDTQSFSFLNNVQFTSGKLATIMREFGDWLYKNHNDKI